MTHGGLLSTQEAVYHGVPVLGLPFISDQLLNMDKAVRDGYALQIRWNQIEEWRIYQTITQLISTRRYSQRVRHLQSLLHDQPETPLERGIYWTEYFIRHQGAGHLRLASRSLSRFQRSMIDVYLVLALVSALFLAIAWRCLKLSWTLLWRMEVSVRFWKYGLLY